MDQIRKMRALIPDVMIYCGVIEADKESASSLLQFVSKINNVEVISKSPSGNEWVTLSKLHDDCVKRWSANQPILYCHTKGAYNLQVQPQIIPIWREWMEYFNFYRYQDALDALSGKYKTYGFDAWMLPRRPMLARLGFPPRIRFYSGNYWWSTAGSLRQISIDAIDREWRHSAEADFIRRIPRLKHFDALQLIGLPSIVSGAYTNYVDDFLHFPTLMDKYSVVEEMRTKLNASS